MLPQDIVETLRARYPHPVACNGSHNQPGYCVAGAFCLQACKIYRAPDGCNKAFPTPKELAEVLVCCYPALHDDQPALVTWTEEIIRSNDARNFRFAWEVLTAVIDRAFRDMPWAWREEAPAPRAVRHRRRVKSIEVRMRERAAARISCEERGIRIRFRHRMYHVPVTIQ